MAQRPAVRGVPASVLTTRQTMRAVIQDGYGTSDVLRIAEIPRPVPRPEEVLVRVSAVSVNARDWHIMRGEPRVARLMDRTIFGWRAPRNPVRGTDFAGVIEEVGQGVPDWLPGDRVFGEASATLAEYVAAPVSGLARVPDGVTMEQASALPLAATTALECLRAADPSPGSTALIVGASGGVGSFVLQLARSMGLDVTAVCSARNSEQAQLLGARRVIDYTEQDVVVAGTTYDLVVDLVGNRSLRDLRRLVVPGGCLVLSGGGVPDQGRILGAVKLLVRAQLVRNTEDFRVFTPQVVPNRENLERLGNLFDAGELTARIECVFKFEDAAMALRRLETEHAGAKVVVTLDE